jgi:hypothetical protein
MPIYSAILHNLFSLELTLLQALIVKKIYDILYYKNHKLTVDMQEYRYNIEEAHNNEDYEPGNSKADFWNKRPTLNFISLMLIFLLIAACLIAVVFVMNLGHGEIISEFYILGKDNKAVNYPSEVALGDTTEVVLGIINHEYSRQAYTIEISIDGAIVDNIGPVILENGQKWQESVMIKPVKQGANQKVEFILNRDIQNSQKLNKPLSLYIFLNVE